MKGIKPRRWKRALLTALSAPLIATAIIPNTMVAHAQQQPLKGLLVFARFEDDSITTSGITRAEIAWSDPTMLPPFASTLLAPDPVPPFPDSSLTDYFHRQSLGSFFIYGNAYPEVITLSKEADYLVNRSAWLSRTRITRDILAALSADSSFTFDSYDADGDGHLDHLFVIVHKASATLCGTAGAAAISDIGMVDPTQRYGSGAGLKVDRGSYYHYRSPGIIIPNKDLLRLMAHEVGHYLWDANTPLRTLHSLPALADIPTNGREYLGYQLMAGGGVISDARGDYTIAPAEREMLGWIDCAVPDSRGSITMRDLYTSNDCVRLSVRKQNEPPLALFVVNRQRVGYFDRLTRNGYRGSDHGLMTTGILVQASLGRALTTIPADGDLAISCFSSDYDGDLFGPDSKTQLTPWTRPDINGYNQYPEAFSLGEDGFQALDDIRYTDGSDGEMAFEYTPDFRESPTFREDSWIGDESTGQRLFGLSRITAGVTVTVSTEIEFADTLIAEFGSTLVIEAEAEVTVSERLEVQQGATVLLRGTLIVEGSAAVSPGGIVNEVGGALLGTELANELPDAFSRRSSVSAYPNPFTSEVHVELDPGTRFDLAVFDVQGRQLDKVQGVGRVTWRPADHVRGGTYLFRIETRQGAITKPLVLIR